MMNKMTYSKSYNPSDTQALKELKDFCEDGACLCDTAADVATQRRYVRFFGELHRRYTVAASAFEKMLEGSRPRHDRCSPAVTNWKRPEVPRIGIFADVQALSWRRADVFYRVLNTNLSSQIRKRVVDQARLLCEPYQWSAQPE